MNTRKNIFVIVAALLLQMSPALIMAQGTLEFNRVLLLTNSSATVPDGKVWKVEAGYYNPLTRIETKGTGTVVLLNPMWACIPWFPDHSAVFVIPQKCIYSVNGVEYVGENFPLWLPEKTVLSTSAKSYSVPAFAIGGTQAQNSSCASNIMVTGYVYYPAANLTQNNSLSIIEFNIIP